MKQAAEIGLFFFGVAGELGDAFAEQRGEKGMLPEGGELFGREAFAGELHHGAGEDQSAQAIDTKKDGSFFNIDDAAAQANIAELHTRRTCADRLGSRRMTLPTALRSTGEVFSSAFRSST